MSTNEPARRGYFSKLWEWCRKRPVVAALAVLIALQQLAFTALFFLLIYRYEAEVRELQNEIEELRTRLAK
jgi:hypothetical protein